MAAVTIGHSVQHELEGCLASIEEHAAMPVQVLVVDNASRDGTLSWLRSAHPEAEVVALESNIWGGARNWALPRVRAPYTLFIDSDAALTPGALPAMVAALEDNPRVGMVCPRLEYPDGRHQLSCRRYPPLGLPIMRRPPFSRVLEHSAPVDRHLMRDMDPDASRPVLYAIGACQLIRTALFDEVGALDVAIGRGGCEDIDWGLRLWAAGHEVLYLPRARVVHGYRRASSRQPLTLGAWRHLKAFVRVQWKHRRRRRWFLDLSSELDRRAAEACK